MSDIDKKHQNSNDLTKAPLIDHLIELRSRLIKSIIVFFIVFLISFYFSSDIHSFLVKPFFSIVGSSGEMIYTAPQEFLMTKLKIAFFGASLIGLPYFVIQLYLFLAPGLYKNEKMALIPYLIATPFLFLISTLMVHYIIMPLALNFFVSMQIDSNIDNISIKLLPKVSEYLKLSTSRIVNIISKSGHYWFRKFKKRKKICNCFNFFSRCISDSTRFNKSNWFSNSNTFIV